MSETDRLGDDTGQETLDNEPMECEPCGHVGYDVEAVQDGPSYHHLCNQCDPRRTPATDGGTDRLGDGVAQRDPTEDPQACSMCGVHIGLGNEYCDGCAREVGAKPPIRICLGCGERGPQEQMETVDVSPEDEYYPDIRYLCRSCGGGD